ncbi:segregation and condensation protein B [Hathewaya proteolytica DSM 3090]|uniref:Segregation and condensation protein B n=1 Tax=Hathewaya proteolytica DSM 3090 TaxID=1121331 RepID=A0A1M6KZV9_9CLOT|nr:SMC-Scp complex subunit ScpB [Hathewaya proteolytica]SHJ64396.1 segregation and condensation protein B [Hathewaya proteolytica DSM 3090]
MENFNENNSRYYSIIESLLFVSGNPLKLSDIASTLECSTDFVHSVMVEMDELYKREDRGIQLYRLNDTYQLVTKKENSTYIQRLLKINTRQSLSQASLEVLAIIAYKQPITRVEIEEIRGVKCDRVITNLTEKGLIKEIGRKDIIGRPILYSTTEEFLRYFQLQDLKQLPNIEQMTFDLQ